MSYLEENNAIGVFNNGRSVGSEEVFDFRVLAARVEFGRRLATWQARHFDTDRAVI